MSLIALLGHLVCWLLVLVVALLLGKAMSGGVFSSDPYEVLGVSLAAGLGLLASLVFGLGLLDLLALGPVCFAVLSVELAIWQTWRDSVASARPGLRALDARTAARWALLLALVLIPPVALALYPATGFDGNVYHLPYARAFVEEGGLTFLPHLRFPVFPQLWEMLFVLSLLFSGDVLAQLLHLCSVLVTACLVMAWGRRFFSSRVGTWAAALWLGTPLALWIGAAAYVDLGLTLFVTASLYAWERWREEQQGRWLGLAALLVAFAGATKYLGLFFLAALVILQAVESWRRRQIRPLVQFTLLSILATAPTYLRILYHTGNPVFPYYSQVFGASQWAAGLSPKGAAGQGTGLFVSLLSLAKEQSLVVLEGIPSLLLVPWDSVFDRQVFNFQAPLSPFCIILLPLCLPLALGFKQLQRLLVVALLYGLFWLTTIRDIRFLLPVLPILCLAMAQGLDGWLQRIRWRRATGWLVPALALLLWLPGNLYAGYKLWQRGALPLSSEARNEYLTRRVRGYEGIHYLNRTLGSSYTVYALYGENLNYLAKGELLGDWTGSARYSKILAAMDNGERLYSALLEQGADHFLVIRRPEGAAPPQDESFAQRFTLVLERPDFLLYAL